MCSGHAIVMLKIMIKDTVYMTEDYTCHSYHNSGDD